MVGFAPVVCRDSSERAAYRKESQSASYESSVHDDFDTQMDTLVGCWNKKQEPLAPHFQMLMLGSLHWATCIHTLCRNSNEESTCKWCLSNFVQQMFFRPCQRKVGVEWIQWICGLWSTTRAPIHHLLVLDLPSTWYISNWFSKTLSYLVLLRTNRTPIWLPFIPARCDKVGLPSQLEQ
jgi:hypothetical protein